MISLSVQTQSAPWIPARGGGGVRSSYRVPKMNEIVKVPGEMNWGYDFAAQITDVFFSDAPASVSDSCC